MTYLDQRGFPVPRVDEVSADGTGIVMERLDGMTMVDALGRKPWTVRRGAAVLADLHRQLHEIPAPDFLPPAPAPVGAGNAIVHLDFHPLNVMMTTRGPVVIDWPLASRGDPASDVALAWALMTAGAIPVGGIRGEVMERFRSVLVTSFLRGVDEAAACRALGPAVEWKLTDAHLSGHEQAQMRSLVAMRGIG
jgi:aminoglycoside phosphotransferase (APT) family kinase protein